MTVYTLACVVGRKPDHETVTTSLVRSTPGDTVADRPPDPLAVAAALAGGSAETGPARPTVDRVVKENTARARAVARRSRSKIRGEGRESSVTAKGSCQSSGSSLAETR